MNLEKGEEREMMDRQNTKLMEEYKHQSIREGEMRILADKNKREVQKKVHFVLFRSSSISYTMRNSPQITCWHRHCSKKTWLTKLLNTTRSVPLRRNTMKTWPRPTPTRLRYQK